jgi:hypothetical protein
MLRGPRAARAAEETTARARSLARTVGIAARRGPVHGNCLARSVLLHALLEREHIAAELRLGVTRDDGNFAAHAWVERDGEPLNDATDVTSRYGAFERDFAARPGSAR